MSFISLHVVDMVNARHDIWFYFFSLSSFSGYIGNILTNYGMIWVARVCPSESFLNVYVNSRLVFGFCGGGREQLSWYMSCFMTMWKRVMDLDPASKAYQYNPMTSLRVQNRPSKLHLTNQNIIKYLKLDFPSTRKNPLKPNSEAQNNSVTPLRAANNSLRQSVSNMSHHWLNITDYSTTLVIRGTLPNAHHLINELIYEHDQWFKNSDFITSAQRFDHHQHRFHLTSEIIFGRSFIHSYNFIPIKFIFKHIHGGWKRCSIICPFSSII